MSYDTTITTYVASTGDVIEVCSNPFSTEVILKEMGYAWWDCFDVRVEGKFLCFTNHQNHKPERFRIELL